MTADIKMKGSRKHEEDFAALIGGSRVPGSGSQWHAKADAANQHFELFAFRGDCKCTQGQSIAVSRAMLKKLFEDAGAERPALPLRFYANERLDVTYDLVAITAADFGELLENARENAENKAELDALKERVAQAMLVHIPDHFTDEQMAEFAEQLQQALEKGGPLRVLEEAAGPDETFNAMSAALIAAQDRQAELEGQLTEQKERADDLGRQLREANAELMRRRGDDLERSQIAQMNQEHAEAGLVVQSDPGELERLRGQVEERDRHLLEAVQENDRIVGLLHDASQEVEILRAATPVPAPAPQPDAPSPVPDAIPQLPWMVVHQVKLPGERVALTGVWWDQNGHPHPTVVRSIRLQPDSPTTEQLFVNDRRVREGDLYIAGERRLRVGAL
jgi:hypothetical protein